MMTFDLSYGKRLYDWWGKHRVAYGLMSWLVFLGREGSLRDRAVGLIGLEAGDTVLDLGCGNGISFELLERTVGRQGRIIAFDYSEGMLRSAAERASARDWQNIQYMQGDAAHMDLGRNSLDGAFCSLALSVVPDHNAAIRNVFNALRPRTRFVVLDAKPFDGRARIFNSIMKPVFEYSTNWNYNKDLVGSLNEAFGAVETHEFNSGSIFIAVATKAGEEGG